jgi:hypothetical protein
MHSIVVMKLFTFLHTNNLTDVNMARNWIQKFIMENNTQIITRCKLGRNTMVLVNDFTKKSPLQLVYCIIK